MDAGALTYSIGLLGHLVLVSRVSCLVSRGQQLIGLLEVINTV